MLINNLYVVHAKAMGLKLWICVGSLFLVYKYSVVMFSKCSE